MNTNIVQRGVRFGLPFVIGFYKVPKSENVNVKM